MLPWVWHEIILVLTAFGVMANQACDLPSMSLVLLTGWMAFPVELVPWFKLIGDPGIPHRNLPITDSTWIRHPT